MFNRLDLPALLLGIASTLAGIGLSRFAYTPLLPALVEQGWFTASQAAYLGAANLLGYFIGALSGHALSERFPARRVLVCAFVIIGLSFLFCARPGAFGWFFVWRLAAGIAGAVLVVVGPSLALAATPVSRRTQVGAMAFMGIGLGVLLSATLVPLFMTLSLTATWLVLGLACLLVGWLGDRGMATLPTPPPAPSRTDGHPGTHHVPMAVVCLVMAAYALDGAGFVPHTVFWVDYLVREAALGQATGSLQWALFGIGAVLGPLLAGLTARRLGWHGALASAFMLKALAVALPLVSLALVSRSLSSLLVGAMIPGVVALTSGRLAELVGPQAHKRMWGWATASFAAAQALSGYGMSAWYATLGTYLPLYALGAALLAAGGCLVLMSRRVGKHRPAAPMS